MKINMLLITLILICIACRRNTQLVYEAGEGKEKLKILLEDGPVMYRSITRLYLQFDKKAPIQLHFPRAYNLPIANSTVPDTNIIHLRISEVDRQPGSRLSAIYLDAEQYDREEFGQFATCLQEHLTGINTFLVSHKNKQDKLSFHATPLNIGAVVYRLPEEYANDYYAPKRDRFLRIYPGGGCQLFEVNGNETTPMPSATEYEFSDLNSVGDTLVIFSNAFSTIDFIADYVNPSTDRKLHEDYRLIFSPFVKRL